MNLEDMPINEEFFAGFDKRTLKISHPWPREAEDRVNQLLGQVAAKEAECQRLREIVGAHRPLADVAKRLDAAISWLRDGKDIGNGIGVADMIALRALLRSMADA